MPSLRAIRKRIATIRNTGQITKAMKMVSAAKLRRAQERVIAARPYADKMSEVLASLAARTDPGRHPLLMVREERRVEVVVITSDRGLCGAYNNNIIKTTEAFLRERDFEAPSLVVVGKKGRDYFRKQGYQIKGEYLGIAALPQYSHAATIGRGLVTAYEDLEIDSAYLVYSRFYSVMTQRPVIQRLLPIEPVEKKAGEVLVEYIFEPTPREIFDKLLPRHLEVQVFRALLEAASSEHAARMTAMDNATKNAEEMVGRLTIQMNRARQEAITKEILDIINGAEAQRRGAT